jgi:hypothetical protein
MHALTTEIYYSQNIYILKPVEVPLEEWYHMVYPNPSGARLVENLIVELLVNIAVRKQDRARDFQLACSQWPLLIDENHHAGWQRRLKLKDMCLILDFEEQSCLRKREGATDVRDPAATVKAMLGRKKVAMKASKVEVEVKGLHCHNCDDLCKLALETEIKRLFEIDDGGDGDIRAREQRLLQIANGQNVQPLVVGLLRCLPILF